MRAKATATLTIIVTTCVVIIGAPSTVTGQDDPSYEADTDRPATTVDESTTTTTGVVSVGSGGGDGSVPDPCFWAPFDEFNVPATDAWGMGGYAVMAGEPPDHDDAVLYAYGCPQGEYFRITDMAWWVPGDPIPGAVTESSVDIAYALHAEVSGTLPDPEVSANPPVGTAGLVNLPTFVRVDNWIEPFTDSDCDDATGTLCVEVDATPVLEYWPGDDTRRATPCEGPGQLYDSALDADPWEQAAWDTTCTHTYQTRTGTQGRPDAWPAEVRIVWKFTWQDNQGNNGDLPTIVTTTTLNREILERQAITTN